MRGFASHQEEIVLTFNSLGGVQLIDEAGEPCTLRSRKHVGLLLYLLSSERRIHTRQRLCEFFWTSPRARARHSLSQAVYDITCRLGPVIRRSSGGDLAVDRAGVRYDVTSFEQAVRLGNLAEAVELYQGPFAANLVDAGTDDFERWIESERMRLSRLAELATRRYVADCEARGQWGDMCVAALRLASLTPLDEDVHRTFMRGLWLQGDAASALRHYERTVIDLSHELPGGLSPETHELAERIRRTPNPARDLPRSIDREPPFVGRDEEYQVLRRLARDIESVDTTAVVVSGEAGIGKSRLLKEFARSLAADPVRVLVSRCYQAEEDLPYSPIVDGLQPLVASFVAMDPTIRDRFRRLAYLLPDFGTRDADEERSAVDPGAWRRQLYEEVASFLAEAIGQQPIIWLLDDAQWIDRTSAGLYHYLARRLSGLPFLIALTIRNPRSAEELPPLPVPAPAGSSNTRSLPLRTLTEDDVRKIVRHAEPEGLGHPAAELAVRLSGGNPYYALEVLEAATESREWARSAEEWDPLNHDRLRSVLDVRISGLSPAALRLLRSIAVLERHARARLVASVSELTMGEAARMADELYTRSLISDDEERIEFTNDTMREFVYAGMTHLQRAALHLNAGNALEAESDQIPGALATHFYHGDDWHRAYGYAMEAAVSAQASAGHTEAAHFAGIAATVAPGTAERRVALEIRADSLYAAGELAEAATCYRQILQEREEMEPGVVARIGLALAEVLTENCRWQEAQGALDDALSTIQTLGDSNRRIHYTAEHCMLSFRRASRVEDTISADAAARRLASATEELDSMGTPSRPTFFVVQLANAVRVAITGSSREALEYLNQAEENIDAGDSRHVHLFGRLRGVLLAWLGRWDSAAADFQAEAERALRAGDRVALATAKNNLACVSLERGDWSAATQYVEEASDVAASLDEMNDTQVAILMNRANLLFYQGYVPRAKAAFREALMVCQRQGSQSDALEIASCLGLLALQSGEHTEARSIWTSLVGSEQPLLGGRDSFKYHWFAWAMGGFDASALSAALEREKARDLPSYLKLLWLVTSEGHSAQEACESLRSELVNYELGWFCHVARRWSQRFRLAAAPSPV